MIPMMVRVLRETKTSKGDSPEDDATLTALVEDFVMTLNGKQTIYQMIRLAEEVEKRGGKPVRGRLSKMVRRYEARPVSSPFQ